MQAYFSLLVAAMAIALNGATIDLTGAVVDNRSVRYSALIIPALNVISPQFSITDPVAADSGDKGTGKKFLSGNLSANAILSAAVDTMHPNATGQLIAACPRMDRTIFEGQIQPY